MARVQLSIPEDDRDRIVHRAERFKSAGELRRFFEECDAQRGPGTEPDWDEHLRTIEASRAAGRPND